jgi:hypothetical protein
MFFAIIAGLILLATIIGLDIYFVLDGIKGNTWSEMIRKLGFILTFIPWAWGGLGGHFFHPNWKQIIQSPGNIAMMVWLSVVVTMIGGAVMKSGWSYAHWVPFITFFVAAVVIGKLWPV